MTCRTTILSLQVFLTILLASEIQIPLKIILYCVISPPSFSIIGLSMASYFPIYAYVIFICVRGGFDTVKI